MWSEKKKKKRKQARVVSFRSDENEDEGDE